MKQASTMYEDSQRFSEEEGDESSHVVSINPRSMMTYGRDQRGNIVDDVGSRVLPARTMQRDVGEEASPPVMGIDANIETPKYDELNTNIREESLQRILSRLSPHGQRIFLRTLSEGDIDVRPPLPFSVPETDTEDEHSELGEPTDIRSEIDYLLDSSIPELTNKSLIPPPDWEGIQSRPLMGIHSNVMVRIPKPDTKVHTTLVNADRCPREGFIRQPSKEQPSGDVRISQSYARPKPFLPSELERARIQRNLFSEGQARERDPNVRHSEHLRVYETKAGNLYARTTSVTNVVWSNRGALSTIKESGPFRPIPSTRVVDSNKTYPKLLTGVEMFRSTGSPFDSDTDMMHAERAGVGHPVASSAGTMKYRYFEPIENRSSREYNVMQTRSGHSCNDRHSVVPIKGRTDPLGGGTNRCITRPGPQFFRGSGGDMLEDHGYCVTLPAPTETYRGVPLENMPAPRPPQSGAQTREVYPDFRDVTAVPACRYDDQGDAGCGHYVPLQEKGPPNLTQSFYGEISGGFEKIDPQGVKSFVARGEPVRSGGGPTFRKRHQPRNPDKMMTDLR